MATAPIHLFFTHDSMQKGSAKIAAYAKGKRYLGDQALVP
jgi:hypothetical protein